MSGVDLAINSLQQSASALRRTQQPDSQQYLAILALEAAASLLDCHRDTGIDLHEWPECKDLVEHLLGHPIP